MIVKALQHEHFLRLRKRRVVQKEAAPVHIVIQSRRPYSIIPKSSYRVKEECVLSSHG